MSILNLEWASIIKPNLGEDRFWGDTFCGKLLKQLIGRFARVTLAYDTLSSDRCVRKEYFSPHNYSYCSTNHSIRPFLQVFYLCYCLDFSVHRKHTSTSERRPYLTIVDLTATEFLGLRCSRRKLPRRIRSVEGHFTSS